MTLWSDIQAAQVTVDQDKAKLSADQVALDALLLQQVKGGPDVSKFQGDVDWVKVKTVADLVFPRVCDGDEPDSFYSAARVSSIRSAGLFFTPYCYGRIASDTNGQRTARTEAAMDYYFASKGGWGKSGDLPLAYDIEKNVGETNTVQGQTATKAATHLIGWVVAYQGLTGHWPVIYSNPSTLGTVIGVMTVAQKATLANCLLWIADWDKTAPAVPSPFTNWSFWQYTNNGTCPGVTGLVDMNHCSLAKTELPLIGG